MKSLAFGLFFFNLVLVFNLQSQYLVEEFKPRIKSAAHNAEHVLQDDGKIVMLGDYAFVGDSAVANLLRFHPDGSLDKDFVLEAALTDMFTTDFGSCCSQSSVIQGVGSDLVLMTEGFPRKAIIIDESGQFKAEIPTPTGYIQIERIVAHYDGYIAVFHKFVSEQSVFRLDHEGNVDPDFTRLDYTGYIPEMKIDANGNIVLVGDITIGDTTKNLVRISESGVLDNSFNNISFIPNFPELDFFPDGKILLSSYAYIALLDADGYPIDTFVPDTGGHPIYSSVVDPVNNRIIVLMDPYPSPNVVKALELDGSVSEDFTPISISSTNSLTNIYHRDGKFVLAGIWELEYESAGHSFLVFDAMGNISTNISTKENLFTVGKVNTAVGLEDGSVIIGGKFSHIGNTQVNNLAKLDRSGNVDKDFNLNNPLSLGDEVRKIEISSDNKMYLGGFFKNILDNPQNSLVRMSLEGELDLSFSTNLTSSGSEEFLSDFVIMDDRIIASGAYYQRVVAFDFDGDEISSFNGDIFEEPFVSVKSICVVDEDNFAISGVDLNGDGFLWVMDPDGNIDNSFARKDDIPISSEHIVKVGRYLYRSGKILSGQSSGDADFIYRYDLETGNIDQSAFSTYTISENRHLLALNDSVVLISGRFDRFNTTAAHNFAASNFEGQVYERLKFDISPGIKGYDLQRTVAISNEEVLLLGQFNSINGKPFCSIALLNTANFTPEMSLNESYEIPEDTSFYAVDLFKIIDLDDELEISIADNENLFIDENGLISLQDNFNGSTELTFTVSDSFAQHGPFSTTLTVNPVNDAPVFTTSGNVIVDEDFAETQTITVTEGEVPSDEAGQTVSYSISPASVDFAVVSIDSETGAVTILAVGDRHGTQEFTITADDGQASDNTATLTFTLTVSPVNEAPVFTISGDVVVEEDFEGTQTIIVAEGEVPSEEAGQTVSYSISPVSVDFAVVSIDSQTGVVTISAVSDGNGAQEFTITADDGQESNNTATQTFTLTVNPVNDAPVFTSSGDVVIDEDFAEKPTITVTEGEVPSDELGQTVSYSISPASADFAVASIDSETGAVTILVVGDRHGTQEFTITADDGQSSNNTATQTFTLTINPINDAPVFTTSGNVIVDEDFAETQTITVTQGEVPSDEAGQTVSYSISPVSVDFATVSIDSEIGAVTILAMGDRHGTQEFTITADDGQASNNTATQTFTLTVSPVNDAPVFTTSGNVIADEDFAETQTITVTEGEVPSNEAGQTVSYSISPASVDFAVVSIDSETGMVTISAVGDGNGTQEFTMTADDGQASNNTATQTFTLTVNPVNDAPFFNGVESQTITAGEILQISIFVQDIDSENVSLTATSANSMIVENGEIIVVKNDVNNFTITLSPNGDVFGQVVVNLIASDGIIESTGSFNLEVLPGSLTGIADSIGVKVFPNPAKEVVWVKNASGFGKNAKFRMTGLNGEVLHDRNVEDQHEIAISISALPNGIYFLTLLNDNGRIVKKIIKE